MRCGFCNLFTTAQPDAALVGGYVEAVRRQARVVREVLPAARFVQYAVGGGTPTYLPPAQLEQLLGTVERIVGGTLRDLPGSIETSPATCDEDRLQVLVDFGVRRISLGVQSFVEQECASMGRSQQRREVHTALERIRARQFPVLNVDLIYGDPTQTIDSWLESIREALEYAPEELFLYPLYVRPETGLDRIGKQASSARLRLYRAGREWLLSHGYAQVSMRAFRRMGAECHVSATDYCCQRDGMVGMGCGARSYTARLHYATRFAVTKAGVLAILRDWMAQSEDDFAYATHGMWLNDEECRRRFIVLSLLQTFGMDSHEYQSRFGGDPLDDFPILEQLIASGDAGWSFGTASEARLLRLTDRGLEQSDAIGPALYSEAVRGCLERFTRMAR
jgi:oxygen-independent coproporphyrinogen-3 oxidase